MGAHIGPHDGQSPLEALIDRVLPFDKERYLVCSAGNDALSGLSSRCELRNGMRDFMRIQTSGVGCREILVEFWWEEPQNSTMTMTAELYRSGVRVGMPLTIDTASNGPLISGVKLARATGTTGFQTAVCESLFHSRCNGIFSCVAFALSAGDPADLARLTIDVKMQCSRQLGVAVNAWIVVADNDGAHFVSGGHGGSVTVPATYGKGLAVAGVEDTQSSDPWLRPQPWAFSSRGPNADYGVNGHSQSLVEQPKLAHDVAGSFQGRGTSFAAPRAAGDVVESVLKDAATVAMPLAVKRYSSVDELAQRVVVRQTHGQRLLPDRSDRVGFGAILD
jgi:hypothetical protein